MTELKTLKELDLFRKIDEGTINSLEVYEQLRKEAIKWIKFLTTNQIINVRTHDVETDQIPIAFFDKTGDMCDAGKAQYEINQGTITFLKHFFNITQEELSK